MPNHERGLVGLGTAGRAWIPVGRAAVAALLVLFVQTYQAPAGHPAAGFVHPTARSLTLVLALLACVQLAPRLRSSGSFASWALAADAVLAVAVPKRR